MVPYLFFVWNDLGSTGVGAGSIMELARGSGRETSAEGLVFCVSLSFMASLVRTEPSHVPGFITHGSYFEESVFVHSPFLGYGAGVAGFNILS